jgi:chromosome segregation protein
MRLQELYIKGFKSFATETVIHFNDKVTGIVGPNGSGKSNIVDAIRWVLGEQKSRELRLQKMGDILFNGTKSRKASPMAKVALTFSNDKGILPTEYSTVHIARVLYRSGESEYLLNDVPCRLKDIQSLFIDTGIGSDSYAIIALGMVDDILADKENARSRMFEQAAGISKYKKRKRDTLLKLKNTEEDLTRVQDLLFEIEGNLKSLERQAKRTKKYFEIKEQYKLLSIQLSLAKSEKYTSKHDTLKKHLQGLEDEIRIVETRRTSEEARLEKERSLLLEKEQNLSGLQRKLSELLSDLRQKESDKQIKDQQLRFSRENKQQLSTQITEYESKLQQLKVDATLLSEELKQIDINKREKDKDVVEKEDSYKKVLDEQNAVKDNLQKLQGRKQSVEQEYTNLEKSLAVNANKLEQVKDEKSRILVQSEEASKTLEKLTAEKTVLKKRDKNLKNELAKLETLEKDRAFRLEKISEELEKWQDRLRETQRSLDAKRNERDLLKSMVDKLEGFPESVKFLNKYWDSPAPLISDLIYCESQYRPAVEYVLEPYLNHYVVNDEEAAIQSIQVLTEAQHGKVSFFILDKIQDIEPLIDSVPDAIPALDVVEVDKKFKRLFYYLLNGVYIVQDAHWKSVSIQASETLTLVSQSGGMYRRGHQMSGGSVGLFEGKKLGRKKNLEKLDLELEKLKKHRDQIEEELLKIKREKLLLEEENLQKEIKNTHTDLAQLEKELYQLESKESMIDAEAGNRKHRTLELDKILGELLEIEKNTTHRLSELTEQLDSLEGEVSQTGGLFGNVDSVLSSHRDALNQARILQLQAKGEVDRISRELDFMQKQTQEIEERIQRNKEEKIAQIEKEEQLEREISDLTELLQTLYAKKKAESNHLDSFEQAFFAERNAIHEIEKLIRNINREIQEKQTELNAQKDEFSEINLKVHSISDRLEAEFNITLDQAKELVGDLEIEDFDELEMKSSKLKGKLENFGEINPMAVEAYDAIKERYDAINEQQTDILEAKDSLLDTIQEIESKATEQFMEAFNQVRKYFSEVFRSLFTEDDDCDLILLDETNPLESSIEIIAKPKGKRPKSLSQLSGGEKTLTATALLFALYLLKPAPFCIFDEVDAPLDDANIQKFNKIVQKFSEKSQFIIITHNKLTMASVDIIYGVYMEETGVSGVSSVDFRHLEHQELAL